MNAKKNKKAANKFEGILIVSHGGGVIYANDYSGGYYRGSCRVSPEDAKVMLKNGAKSGNIR